MATAAFAAFDTANALNTISLLSITNLDGSPIQDASFSFDSGLVFPQSEVPEPATLALVATGLGGALWRCRRARRNASGV